MNHFSWLALVAGFLFIGNACAMEQQPTQAITSVILDYLDACCYHPNPGKLESLLDPNCSMEHYTNDVLVTKVSGINDVMDAYKANLFSKTTGIVVSEVATIVNASDAGSLNITVSENKPDGRYRFTDLTLLGFTSSYKIATITTRATKDKEEN